ncbi:MAG: selenocysteine-specific translation elongation factor [Limisphaerales bacterium]
MTARNFIVATAGHVDHGKSALVKALTGTDPDRLPEEKARGITIDLGFAHLELSALSPQPATFHLGIVDVPGHEDFVKNMVAGVGSIDLALFVVAADDGWMPQTEEHLEILTYLGVTRAVVALTKIDLAEGGEAAIIAAIGRQLQHSPFANAPIVPTSVVTGRGLDELKAALTAVLAQTPSPRDIGKPRLPVDRVFTLRGIGTVVTGTLIGGPLRRGQAVIIQPSGTVTRVRSVQNHNHDVETSGPGTRTALNLPDVEAAADSGHATGGVRRGDVITLAEFGGASNTLDVLIEKSARLGHDPAEENDPARVDARPPANRAAARPLKDAARVRVHHGSGNFPARVHFADGKALTPGARALAELRMESPIFAFVGDHFIVRDWAEQATLAGGIVLDGDAQRKSFRSPAQQTFLTQRGASPDQLSVMVSSQLARDGAARRSQLLLKSRLSAAEIAAAADDLVRAGGAIVAADWVADHAWWQGLRRRAAETVDAAHRAHPERVGLPLSELRAAAEADLPAPEVFEALLTDLCQKDFATVGTAIRRASHRPALPPQLQAAGARIRAALSAKPLEPPSRKELAPDAVAQQALRFLIDTGEAIDLGPELVLLVEHCNRATEAVKKFLRERGAATVSELRQVVGTSRRIMVPLLERLDRDGVTRREGDRRVLRTRG